MTYKWPAAQQACMAPKQGNLLLSVTIVLVNTERKRSLMVLGHALDGQIL